MAILGNMHIDSKVMEVIEHHMPISHSPCCRRSNALLFIFTSGQGGAPRWSRAYPDTVCQGEEEVRSRNKKYQDLSSNTSIRCHLKAILA